MRARGRAARRERLAGASRVIRADGAARERRRRVAPSIPDPAGRSSRMAREAPMNYRILNLAAAVVWLLVAAYFLRARIGPDQNAAWADPQMTDLYALFAFAFVVWNVTRWYQRRPAQAAAPSLA